MKKVVGCSIQLILLLGVVLFVAVPVACVASATAPLHSPKIAESFVCPPETHLVSEWYQASWNHPGEKTLSVTCVDVEGKTVPTLPQDDELLWKGTTVYFPYIFIFLLIIGFLILLALNVTGIAMGRLFKWMFPAVGMKSRTNS